MQVTLTQFTFEMTLCLSVFYVIYRILPQKLEKDNLLFLLLTACSAVLLPLLSFSADNTFRFFYKEELTQTVYNSFFASIPLSVSYSGNIIITFQDILSFFYLLGFGFFAFKKIDSWSHTNEMIKPSVSSKTSKNKSSFWYNTAIFSQIYHGSEEGIRAFYKKENRFTSFFFSKFPTLIIEFFSLIFWFHPFTYLYRKEFYSNTHKMINKTSISQSQIPEHLSSYIKTTAAVPFLFSFLALFSFDFSKELPFALGIIDTNEAITSWVNKPIFDLDKTQKGTVLDWGRIDLPIVKIGNDALETQRYLTTMMNRPYFKEIKDAELKFYHEGTKQRIIKLEAIFNSPDFEQPLRAVGRKEFQKYVNAISSQREVTVIIKLETEFGEKWMSALAITRYAKLYIDKPEITALIGDNSYIDYVLDTSSPHFLVEKASINVEEEDAIYTVKWGELEIILEKYANPNMYRAYIELDLETAQKNIGNTIEVLKNGSTRSIDGLAFMRYDAIKDKSDAPNWFRFEEINPTYAVILDEKDLDTYEPGTFFRIGLETEDITINSVELRITDPFEPYYPKLSAKNISDDPAEFAFQIINVPDRKTTLKADTLLTENQRNLEMYSDRSRYDIVHIPGFKTNRRLLSADDFIWWHEEGKELENRSLIFKLREYNDYIGQSVGLFWGEIFANPNGINLTRKDIIDNQNFPLVLRVGKDELEIIEFEMIVRRGEEEPEIHFIKRKNGEIRLPDLSEIDIKTGIFIQKIVIQSENDLEYFPINFSFNVGNELSSYDLSIEEVTHGGVAFDTLINKRDSFSFKWENRTLKGVISDMTRFNENYIRLHGNIKNPTLNIDYSSPKINTRSGIYFLNAELRRRYQYSYRSKFETLPSYRMGLGSESKLNAFTVSQQKAENSSDEATIIDGIAVLESATVDDLARFIEEQFGVYIYVVVDVGESYYFSLDISSIEAVTQQLEADYGLQLIHGNYPVRFIDVSFL